MVFVMSAQNAWLSIVSASLTSFKLTASNKLFADSCVFGAPLVFLHFINALSRTIFAFFRRASLKRTLAMRAINCYAAFQMHCFVIARSRTILGRIASRCNVGKSDSTHFTILSGLNSCSKRETSSRTVLSGVLTMFWNTKFNGTILANNYNFGVFHAA